MRSEKETRKGKEKGKNANMVKDEMESLEKFQRELWNGNK